MPPAIPEGVLAPLVAPEAGLASWQIGLIAFAFVAYILLVAMLLERWEVGRHA